MMRLKQNWNVEMTVIKLTCVSIFLFVMSSSFAQSDTDSLDLDSFWIEYVQPLIEGNRQKLETFIEFPLDGEWGFMMELDHPPKNWTENDFYDNYSKLFNEETITRLKNTSSKDLEFFKKEILLNIGWKNEEVELGIFFRYIRVNGSWKLHVIQAVG
jgi:hypothetical protein